eukprot:3196712-Amphidinium_carterae.1
MAREAAAIAQTSSSPPLSRVISSNRLRFARCCIQDVRYVLAFTSATTIRMITSTASPCHEVWDYLVVVSSVKCSASNFSLGDIIYLYLSLSLSNCGAARNRFEVCMLCHASSSEEYMCGCILCTGIVLCHLEGIIRPQAMISIDSKKSSTEAKRLEATSSIRVQSQARTRSLRRRKGINVDKEDSVLQRMCMADATWLRKCS